MATIGYNDNFEDPGSDVAERLYKAMKGLGTDEDTVGLILGTHSNEQLLIVKQTYKAMHGEDLIERIESETDGAYQQCCVGLVRDRMEFMAHMIHYSLKGAGTAEQLLCDILATASPETLEALKEKYAELFESSLEEDVEGDVGGFFRRFLVGVMSGGRISDDDGVDYDRAAEDAQKLYDAGEGSWGTDEEGFMSVIMLNSWSQLTATFQAYEDLLGDEAEEKTLLNAIKREFTGNEEMLLTTIVKYARDKEMENVDYHADVLRDCMKGIGTSETRLLYHIIMRCEIDLALIRDAYSAKYEEDLTDAISSEVGSDLALLLNYLVKGNLE